jgi:energy-coupling factor transport system ATP-binding protein
VIIEHKLAHLLPLEPRLLCIDEGRIVVDTPGHNAKSAPVEESSTRAQQAQSGNSDRSATPGGDSLLVDMSHVTVTAEAETILDDVTLQVRSGEIVGVLGPNGGGKTTLLHCLMGLVQPASGHVRLFGSPVSTTKTSQLARQVGLVFQNADHQLVTEGVLDETLFAARMFGCEDRSTRQRAERLLARAGLADRQGDHPFRLSWGQKRRLNVISGVLHRPRLLLLDEPFAGQDWENATFLLDVLADIVCGHDDERNPGACLVVTHDPRVVRRSCTRVLFLSGGRVRLDAPIATAFDRLREMGHGAYAVGQTARVPTKSAREP